MCMPRRGFYHKQKYFAFDKSREGQSVYVQSMLVHNLPQKVNTAMLHDDDDDDDNDDDNDDDINDDDESLVA